MMEADTLFRILLPAILLAFIIHRGYYTNRYAESKTDTLKKREENWASRISGLLGLIGLFAFLIYLIFPAWIGWASVRLPEWARWAGVCLALAGFALLQWAQNTLGKNWSDTPRMIKEQALVTSGPYRWIRHPIYTAFLLILGSTLLISANWLVGWAWLGMTALEIASRISFEESLMVEYFGDQYHTYSSRTGRLLPRLTR